MAKESSGRPEVADQDLNSKKLKKDEALLKKAKKKGEVQEGEEQAAADQGQQESVFAKDGQIMVAQADGTSSDATGAAAPVDGGGMSAGAWTAAILTTVGVAGIAIAASDNGGGGKDNSNVAPTSSNGNSTIAEDTTLTGTLPAATDANGDTVSYSLQAQAAHGVVTITDAATGAFTYVPNANYNGTDSFTFTVSDGKGGTNTYTYNITVTAVNDAPTASNVTVAATEDVVLAGNLPAATDVDGDTVTYALGAQGTKGVAVVNPDGSYIYTPNANANGNDTFTYTVSDGKGGTNTYTVTVQIAPVNDAPVAQDGVNNTLQNTPVSGAVVATDVDVGQTLTYALASLPANGSVTVDPATGAYTYTPNTGFSGVDSFTVIVSDGAGGTDTATISIGVGQTAFVLTPGTDNFAGSGADDVFIGSNANLNAGDSIVGGGGFDVVTHSVDGGLLNNFAGFILQDIDVFQVTSDAPLSATTTYDLSSSGPIGVLRVVNSTDNIVFNNAAAGAIAANTTFLEILDQTGTTTDVSLDIRDIDVAGANDVVDVTVRSATNTGNAIDDLNIDFAVETVRIHTDGPLAVVIDDLNTDLGGAAGSGAVNVILDAQDSSLTINSALTANVKNVDGSSSTQNLSYSVANANGNTTLSGGTGNDSITGSANNDSITSGDGNDTVNDGAGNDTVITGAGNDVVNLGTGNDSIVLGAGNDTVNSGANLNSLDTITGGDGADLLNISNAASGLTDLNNVTGVERIVLDDVNASYNYAPSLGSAFANDTVGTEVDGSALDVGESLNFNGTNRVGALTLIGGDGNDQLTGGSGDDVIVGDGDAGSATDGGAVNGGNDTLQGGGGNDEFRFDGGELTAGDRIFGGTSGSVVGANTGNDTITLINDGGNLSGGAEVFELDLDANASIELVRVEDNSNGSNQVRLTVVAGHDQALLNVDATELDSIEAFVFDASAVIAGRAFSVTSGAGSDTLTGGAGNDTIRGGLGNDSIVGGAGNNQLFGDDGNDTLVGGAGNDTMSGGIGNDSIDASQGGNDSLDGGEGNDTFNFGATGLTNNGLDSVAGGNGTDTVISAHNGATITDAAFLNFTSTEVLTLTGNGGSGTTLGANAQAAGFTTVNLNGTGSDTLNAGSFTVGLTVNDNGGNSNDVITTGSGADTINMGGGSDNLTLGGGDDVVVVQNTELDFTDSIAAGSGTDRVRLDNTSGAVTAGVNLDNVTGLERYEFVSGGDRLIGIDADNNSLTFTGGNVNTVNAITIDASALTDTDDTFTLTLDANQLDSDFAFNLIGSATRDVFVKNNDGVNNNIQFNGGAGNDELVIRGDDLGSTITMNGGDGIDAIRQRADNIFDKIEDDGYDNISNVEQLLAGGALDRVFATLGAQARDSGLNHIVGGTGDDDVTFDAQFTTDIRVDLFAGGNDSINAGATAAALTINALASGIDGNDTLTGGTSADDMLNLTADNGVADLLNVTNIERINAIENGDLSLTIDLYDSNFTGVASGVLVVDASALDDNDGFEGSLTLNAGGITAGDLDVIGGTGNDTISTGTGDDTINGGAGNDVINAGSGNNIVNGGAGNDSITVGDGDDLVEGGAGNDTIFGGNGLNTLNGGDGNDQITGGVDVDVINGGAGNDEIYGGLGNNGGAGDTLTGGAGSDTFYYVARAESSTSLSGRDVITDFESGVDKIDFRYVTEAIATYGAGALINFAGNAADFATAQGAITSGDGVLDVVYQQDNNVLWVDLNDDGVLNGNDLQIILTGVSGLVGADVFHGFTVGTTVITPGANIVGTILDEVFTFDPSFMPGDTFTLNGGGGTDTIVIDGQDISTSTITNVEIAQVNSSATMTVAQHNGFLDIIEDGDIAAETINISDAGTLTGDADIGQYVLLGGASTFTLGAGDQSITGGAGNDTIKTGLTNDVLTGTIDGGAGTNTLVLDAGDDISGATVTNIATTVITGSSVTMTAAQHGTNGSNGSLGNIVDEGDDGSESTLNPGTFNSPDTITLTTDAVGVTGLASIESYVLAGGDDSFTLGIASQNVDTGAGNNTLTAIAGALTGTLGGSGSDTLVTVSGNDITGADVTAIETIEVNGTLTLTAAQHNGATVQDTDASIDSVVVTTAGTINAATAIETYTLDDNTGPGNTSTLNVNGLTVGVNVNGTSNLDGTNVNVGSLVVTGNYALTGTAADTITATNGADISGVNAGAATTAEVLALTDGITMTLVQHEAFGDIVAGGNADSVTVLGAGTVNAFEDVETYNVSSTGANTVNVNANATGVDVNGDAANNTTVNVGGLTVTGVYTLNAAGDSLVAADGADISGATLNNVENLVQSGSVSMTVAQHTGFLTIDGTTGADEIVLVDAGIILGNASIETYVLADADGNEFTFGAQSQNVFGTGSHNDIVYTGGLAVLDGTLDLAANAGAPNDQIVVTGADVDFSGLNGGGETTAESLDLDNFSATMTEAQHDGFTQIDGVGVNTITLTAANGDGVVAGDADVETYELNDAFTFTLGDAAQNVTGNDGNDQTVIVDGLAATGALDGGVAGNDTLDLRNGADISGAAISGFENLLVTGTVYMTELQYESFNTVTGGAGTTIVITAFDGDGELDIDNNVETYTFEDTGIANVLAGSEAVNINGTATFPLTVNVGGLTVTGTYTLADAADVIVATNGANISGINGGADTTAETIDITGNVTMTVAQYNSFTTIDAAGLADQVTLSDSGTVTADAAVESYVLGALGGSVLNINAGSEAVNVTGTGGADEVVVDAGLAVTGTYNLGGTDDELTATNGVDISAVNGGAATTAEVLNLTGGITMTVAQHEGFTTVNAAGGADVITLNTAGTVTAAAAIETYNLSASGNTIDLATNSVTTVDINGTAAIDTVIVGGQVVGAGSDWALTANDFVSLAGGADITEVNAGAVTGAGNLVLAAGGGTVTMTGDQFVGFTSVTEEVANDVQTVVLATMAAGEVFAGSVIENFVLNDAGNDSITFNGSDAIRAGQSVDLVGGGADVVTIINDGGINAGVDSAVEIRNFLSGSSVLQLDAGNGGGHWDDIDANTPANVAAGTDVIEIEGSYTVDLNDFTGTGDVKTLIADALLSVGAGTYTVIVYSDNSGTADAGIYQFTLGAPAGDLSTLGFDLEYVATLTGVGNGNLAAGDVFNSVDN